MLENVRIVLGPHPHRTRCARKFEYFSFDVACVQCEHPHSHQQVPFAGVALRVVSRVLCGLGPSWVSDRAKGKDIFNKTHLEIIHRPFSAQQTKIYISVKENIQNLRLLRGVS